MTDVSILSEPRVYDRESPNSFFRDLALKEARQDQNAIDRLTRHRIECERDARADEMSQEERDSLAMQGIELRAANSGLGFGGEFDPPAWMIPLFASAGRAGRVVADLISNAGNAFVLPQGVSSINIPRMTTGNTALIQGDGGPVSDVDMVTVNASSEVVTIAGQQDLSQQLYDLTPSPGMDYIMLTDLLRAYNKTLELQLINGTGVATPTSADSQLLGLASITLPSANTISGSGVGTTSTSVSSLWPLLGQAFGQVGNQRLLPPEAFLLSPRRWAWIAGGLDSSNRPLASPGGATYHASTDATPAGDVRPYGPLVGTPAYVTGGIPNGASTENIYAIRPSDFFLWESSPRFIATPQPLGGTLQVRLSLHRYVGAVLNRYPTGIAVVNAIPAPTGY